VIWKLNHKVGTDQILAGEPRAVPAFARPVPWHLRWPWIVLTGDAHVEATRGWSMSFTRFDVAKYQRCRKGDAEANTIALLLKWLLCVALQGLSGPAPKTKCDCSRYSADDHYMVVIIARPRAIIGDSELSAPA
jgi:hypothetical protein